MNERKLVIQPELFTYRLMYDTWRTLQRTCVHWCRAFCKNSNKDFVLQIKWFCVFFMKLSNKSVTYFWYLTAPRRFVILLMRVLVIWASAALLYPKSDTLLRYSWNCQKEYWYWYVFNIIKLIFDGYLCCTSAFGSLLFSVYHIRWHMLMMVMMMAIIAVSLITKPYIWR